MLPDPVLGAYYPLSHLTFPATECTSPHTEPAKSSAGPGNIGSVVQKVGKKCHYNYYDILVKPHLSWVSVSLSEHFYLLFYVALPCTTEYLCRGSKRWLGPGLSCVHTHVQSSSAARWLCQPPNPQGQWCWARRLSYLQAHHPNARQSRHTI